MDRNEDEVEKLVRLGIALANDLVDEHGKTWIHLAENMFENVEHSLTIGACAMLLKMDLDEDDVVVILKIARAEAFSIVYGDPAEIPDWRYSVH